jgi:hypothetical protein
MMKNILSAFVLSALLSGCAAPTKTSYVAPVIEPPQAVILAADAAPAGVGGTFLLEVRGSGRQDGNIYLNSEQDYRDQRCLTIAVLPDAANELRKKYNEDVDSALKGRRIVVKGVARRVKIAFFADGHVTDKYYYQTQVNVSDAGQIELQP